MPRPNDQSFGLNEADLLIRLKNCEDAFVERKTAADSKDWLKTVVAFANSAPIGYPAVLFIGAKDDGTIESGPANLDTMQKTLRKKNGRCVSARVLLLKDLERRRQAVHRHSRSWKCEPAAFRWTVLCASRV